VWPPGREGKAQRWSADPEMSLKPWGKPWENHPLIFPVKPPFIGDVAIFDYQRVIMFGKPSGNQW